MTSAEQRRKFGNGGLFTGFKLPMGIVIFSEADFGWQPLIPDKREVDFREGRFNRKLHHLIHGP